LDDASHLGIRSSKTNNVKDEGMQIQEDDLIGLNWLPDQEVSDGNIQHPETDYMYFENTHVFESAKNTLDEKVGHAYIENQTELENYPRTNHIDTFKENLDENLHIPQSIKGNASSDDFYKVLEGATDIWNCVEENEMEKYFQTEEEMKLEQSIKNMQGLKQHDQHQQTNYQTNVTDELSPSITASPQDQGFCQPSSEENLPSPSLTSKVSKASIRPKKK
jgi:hypothetical protein